jgi:hypothetical protein
MSRGTHQSPRDLALKAASNLERYRDLDAQGLDGSVEVDEAVFLFREALTALDAHDPQEPAYRYNLALALQSRYDDQGEPNGDHTDLRSAISELDTALAAATTADGPTPHPLEATLRYGLGAALRRDHLATNDEATIQRAVGLLGDALRIGGQDTLDIADAQYEYGQALHTYADMSDNATYLNEAIRVLDFLVSNVDPAAPDMQSYLSAAASAYLTRHDRTVRPDDLQRARDLAEQAVAAGRVSGSVSAAALSNLANVLGKCGSRSAAAGTDLDDAVAAGREALSVADPQTDGAASRGGQARDIAAGIRSNLAGILLARLERTNDLEDLDEIVQLCDQAVRDSLPSTTALGLRAHQAALAHRARFLRREIRTDLDVAVQLHRTALECPATDTDRRAMLDSWGNTLRTRFDLDKDVADLRDAVAAYEGALADLDPTAPDRAGRLNNLGAVLAGLADITGEEAATERAAHALTEAVETSEVGSLERVKALINLGNVKADQFTRTGRPEDREAAETAYDQVRSDVGSSHAGREPLLQAAINAAEWAHERQDWAANVSWSQVALDAVDELLILQRKRNDKESWLRDAGGVAVLAAQAAHTIGDHEAAVVLLERGRATLLREAVEQTQADLDLLQTAGAGDLAQLLRAAAAGDPDEQVPGHVVNPTSPNLRDIRDRIRQVPGFGDFLAVPTFDEIAATATDTTLVYLSPGQTAGFATVLRHGVASHLPLPLVTEAAVRDRAESLLGAHDRYVATPPAQRNARRDARLAWTRALDATGDWLWTVLGAILAGELAGEAVHLLPGGLLGLLPIHASWRPDERAPTGRRYLIDEVCVSYVPSATALGAARASLDDGGPATLLTVADPSPTSLPRLPNVRAEADAAAASFAATSWTPLEHDAASLVAVEQALRDCDVVHFGCHGRADVDAPLSSAVFLADDEPLDLRRILTIRTRLRLAVLSACETGVPGTALPDEVVSLPTGLIQAGAAGVIASGWAVPDAATLALMSEFYQRWRSPDPPAESPAAALSAAQTWLRDSTNEAKLARWRGDVDGVQAVPSSVYDVLADTYMMREPEAMDDAEIAAWAAFAHVGI